MSEALTLKGILIYFPQFLNEFAANFSFLISRREASIQVVVTRASNDHDLLDNLFASLLTDLQL